MKKSEFIKKVLKHKHNTVFTTKEQVENALDVFEKLGMQPPKASFKYQGTDGKARDVELYKWKDEHEEK